MRQNKFKFIFIQFTLSVFTFLSLGLFHSEGRAAMLGASVFSENFESGSTSGWTISPLGHGEDFSVVAGRLRYSGAGPTQFYAGPKNLENYRFETRFRLSSFANFPGGIRGRIDPITGRSYAVWIYPAQNRIMLGRTAGWNIDEPGFSVLANATVESIAPGLDHNLALQFEGDLIEVYYNGVKVITAYDSALKTGQIGFDVSNQPIEFDDVTVRKVFRSLPADEGPGGPIIILSDRENPFSRYVTEILDAEGLRSYRALDVSKATAETLANYDVVLLDEVKLTSAQVQTLTSWVEKGGNLIAMKPDSKLANLLGVQFAALSLGPISNGYIQILSSTEIGQGLTHSTRLQFHGQATRMQLQSGKGTINLATLHASADSSDSYSGVTLRTVGSSGGQVAAFAYGLSRSIVQTRQGNPEWSGQERDGLSPIRSSDLFYGPSDLDFKKDWVDFARIEIPQADEQQRLLRKMMLLMNGDRKPLPSFWYLPRQLKAAVIMTGDDHAHNGTQPRFDQYLSLSPSNCSLARWECIRGTSYVFHDTPLSIENSDRYQSLGFEIGLHVNTGCEEATQARMSSALTTQLPEWRKQFPNIAAPVTNRNHCIAWGNFTSPAVESSKYGIRLDTNYYYWPSKWVQDRPGLFTGSGFPMRFANSDGTKIDVYQAATQMTDESGMTYAKHINTLLDNALSEEKGYYAVITANMHTDDSISAGSDAIITAAQSKGVPVISAKQMLNWLDMRNKARFSNLTWKAGIFTFQINNVSGAVPGLQGMLPTAFGGLKLVTVKKGGIIQSWKRLSVKGIDYAFISAGNGTYEAQYK